jgi:GNAT superfamily N-acetyltransferase
MIPTLGAFVSEARRTRLMSKLGLASRSHFVRGKIEYGLRECRLRESATRAATCHLRARAKKGIFARGPYGRGSAMGYTLRKATLEDQATLQELIARSIRQLGASDYSPEQIDAALRGAFGVDTALIRDGTYFVAVSDTNEVVACGGWSRRRTLFGSDTRAERDESSLDPRTDAAKIRAFFVDPAHARRGLGRAILERSEAEASSVGFSTFGLMATLPGVRLYEKFGYLAGEAVTYALPDGLSIRFVPMSKRVGG